jgi:hypothetical protein
VWDEKGAAELGSRLSAAVLQQLQQAGLLQHLPALINAAAQDLTALLPDAEQDPIATAADTSAHRQNSNSGSSGSNSSKSSGRSSSSSSSGSGRDTLSSTVTGGNVSSTARDMMASLQTLQSTSAAWENAKHVLAIFSSIRNVMGTTDAAAAACLQPAPAALQLILTAYEILPRVHKQLQQLEARANMRLNLELQPGKEGIITYTTLACAIQTRSMRAAHVLVWNLTELLVRSGDTLARLSGGQGKPPHGSTVDELLCSPELHRCLTLVTAVMVLGLIDSYHCTSSSGSGSCNSAGGSSSGSSGRSSQRAATPASAARSSSLQGSTAPGAPPAAARRLNAAAGSILANPSSSRLFELLGVEPAAVHYALRQPLLIEQPLVDIFAVYRFYGALLNVHKVRVYDSVSVC